MVDSTLYSLLSTAITPTTTIFGSSTNPGCVDILRMEYDSTYPIFLRRKNFFEYTQKPNQSFTDYSTRLQQLSHSAELGKMTSEQILVHIHIMHAKPEIKAYFLQHEPETLRDLASRAREWQRQQSNTTGGMQAFVNAIDSSEDWIIRPMASKRELLDKGVKCFKCASRNHHSLDCAVSRTSLRCSNCKQEGHVTSVCMGRRSDRSRSRSRGREEYNRNRSRERSQSFGRRESRDRNRSSSRGQQRDRKRTPYPSRERTPDRVYSIEQIEDSSRDSSTDRGVYVVEQETGRRRSIKNMKIKVQQGKVDSIISAIPDSSAVTSIMGMKLAQEMDLEIKAFDTAPQGLMVANGGSLAQNGYCNIDVQFCGKNASVRTTISEDLGSTFLIGRTDLIELGVINKEYPYPPGYFD